jgi:hypothetical protein
MSSGRAGERDLAMKKRKKKIVDVGQIARRRARESGIAPAATRVIVDKRGRAPKHKKQLLDDDVSG